LKSFSDDDQEKSDSDIEGGGLNEACVIENQYEGTKQTTKSEAHPMEVTPKNKGNAVSNVQTATSQSDNSTPCFEAEIVDTSPENNAIVVDSSPEAYGYAKDVSFIDDKENIVPVVNKQEWACPTCTLVNKKSVRKCSVCGTRKVATNVATSQSSNQKKKRSISELK
jgi:hypothetical protein